MTCVSCTFDPLEVVEGVAGASAQREYDRRLAQREARAREQPSILGVILTRVTDEPQSTAAWKKGASGEARTASRLHKLLDGTGVRLRHDRRMPGSRTANIDHVAVGPGGITVIDAKYYRGKVRVQRVGGLFSERRDVLTIAGRDQTKLVHGVERQIAAIRTVVPAYHRPVDIRGALCFADVHGLPLLHRPTVRDVVVDGLRTTAKLASRTGTLTPEQVDCLSQYLGHVLRPA